MYAGTLRHGKSFRNVAIAIVTAGLMWPGEIPEVTHAPNERPTAKPKSTAKASYKVASAKSVCGVRYLRVEYRAQECRSRGERLNSKHEEGTHPCWT